MTTAAVIGCGDVSIVHLEAIEALAGSRLVAVCDMDPDTAARAADRYGVSGFTSHTELLAAVRPDVVHVTEGWTSEEDHHRIFAGDAAQAIVAEIGGLLAGESECTDYVPVRGKAAF